MFRLFRKKTPDERLIETYRGLVEIITGNIMDAEDYSEIEEPMFMLNHLAELGLEHARGMYGLALLMDDKPWYDPKKGLQSLRQAADCGEPFSQHMLGSILYNGQRGIPEDKVSARYWLDKSAESGYDPAMEDVRRIWGSN